MTVDEAEESAVEARAATELDGLLEYLQQARGFDFRGYKRTTLERRIRKRMAEVQVDGFDDYQDYLEVNPAEFTVLFNTILINVTRFFRDKQAWDYLAETIVPQVLEQAGDGHAIRVWSAACSSGEEAYTLAIVLAEALGEDEFSERVKVYATDIDEPALNRARQATYSSDDLEDVPRDLVEKYFEPSPLGMVFRNDLRRSVIFGRNDLVQDAPISRIDLLVSRNALMYFTQETQGQILRHFHFALKETGFLFLGKSEMLVTHGELFTPHELKWRVFRKVPRRNLRERLAVLGEGFRLPEPDEAERHAELRTGAMDASPVPQVVVDRAGFLTIANGRAKAMFGIGPADLGRPLQDLRLSYQPVELRTGIERAYEERAPVPLGPAEWTAPDGSSRTLRVEVTPLIGATDSSGASISFEDVTAYVRLDEEHQRSKRELEKAYEELQSTVEELETTNEELQSTNEELETTNEELQSTNEELETTNEELQSSNDELETMNEEQRSHTAELDRVNSLLEAMLGNLGVGVVILDGGGRIQVWNASSRDLWGVGEEEAVGQKLEDLDIGLPLEPLHEPIGAALSPDRERNTTIVEAVNRRGRAFRCAVRTLPMLASDGAQSGAILLVEEADSGGMVAAADGGED